MFCLTYNVFGIMSKNSFQCHIGFLIFLSRCFVVFAFYIYIYNFFKVIICKDVSYGSCLIFFFFLISMFTRTIYFKNYHFTMEFPLHLYQNQLIIFMCIFFWAFYSIWVVCLSFTNTIFS